MLDKAGIGERGGIAALVPLGAHHQDQRAGIVVEAIAVAPVWHRTERMLQQAGPVAQRMYGGGIRAPQGEGRRAARDGGFADQGGGGLGKARPDRLPPAPIGAAAHGGARVRIVEQRQNRVGDRIGVARFDQAADTIGQQFPRMNIWRRDHRLAERDRIAERARRRLLEVGIGRQINVAAFELVEQFFGFEEAIIPFDVVLHVKPLDQSLQVLAIALPVLGDEIGVSGTHDPIKDPRMARRDGGQRFDGMLQPLPRAEQAEGHHNLTICKAEARLELMFAALGALGRTVLDHNNAAPIDAVARRQHFARMLCHYHDAAGALG